MDVSKKDENYGYKKITQSCKHDEECESSSCETNPDCHYVLHESTCENSGLKICTLTNKLSKPSNFR